MTSVASQISSGNDGTHLQQQVQASACPEDTEIGLRQLQDARQDDRGGMASNQGASAPSSALAPAPPAVVACAATGAQPPAESSEDDVIEVASPVCYASQFTEYAGLASH